MRNVVVLPGVPWLLERVFEQAIEHLQPALATGAFNIYLLLALSTFVRHSCRQEEKALACTVACLGPELTEKHIYLPLCSIHRYQV